MPFDRRDIDNTTVFNQFDVPGFVASRGRMAGSTLYLTSATTSEVVAVDLSMPDNITNRCFDFFNPILDHICYRLEPLFFQHFNRLFLNLLFPCCLWSYIKLSC